MTDKFYFHGQIRPYLQGQNALDVIQQTPGYLVCYLGSKRTRIRLRDFRPQVRQAAQQALEDQSVETFATFFGQSARVKIKLARGKVQIDLYDGKPAEKEPLLWMGVLRDGEVVPFAKIQWKIFRSLSKTQTGFAMLVSG